MLSTVIFYSLIFVLVVLVPAGVILFVLLFLHHERQFWKRAAPLWTPLGSKLAQWRVFSGTARRFPRLVAFLGRRVNPSEAWGLPATVALPVILLGLWFFIGVLQAVMAKNPLVVLDLRLHNAVPLFRTPGMTAIMIRLTQLGGAVFLLLVCSAAAVLALARKHARLAATFLLALAGTGAVSAGLKILIGHARPIDALINASEASFPSGHMLSSTVIYGLLAILLLNSRFGRTVRALGVTGLLLLIVGIGLSRLYLGVHWPSDLLGSLALALMLLPTLLFFLHYEGQVRWVDSWQWPFSPTLARVLAGLLIIAALIWPALRGRQVELVRIGPPAAMHPIDAATLKQGLPADLARRSEDLVGTKMEPVSLVLIGSEAELQASFTQAGWTRAELPTPIRIVQEGLAVARDLPDANGPATPAFVGDKPQDMTYEKPDDGKPSIRQRHHVRLWQTRYCLAPTCRTVWLGTASHDIGVELSARSHLPTHRIQGDIDLERALIVADLTRAGATPQAVFNVIPTLRGKNAAGDVFFTDGRAEMLLLPSPPHPLE